MRLASGRPGAYLILLAIGAAWGISAPMIKVATGAGLAPLMIVFWQALIASVVLGAVLLATGQIRRMRWSGAHLRLYAAVGLLGMALPSIASYSATRHLPSGVISIVISLVPVFALPLALGLGTERFQPRRLLGVASGAAAMALLMGPEASLPDPAQWIWIPVAALAPLCYALEGAVVYQSKAEEVGPFQMLWAGYLVSVMAALGLALFDGTALWPDQVLSVPVLAFVIAGLLGIGAYAGYLWLLRQTGAVFGAQVSYTVTGMGIVWAMLILGERYSGWVWSALALLFLGLFLVQPRPRAPAANSGDAHVRA
ncbi:DMT family transporter [Pararhodobacter sp. CCB-MM2]|uniref:DMT family transporter n=1 Tax=Pararhodobacter sp. CCB-MM2 TaxID=1786003 RepID=UPI000835C468|nr:DMT family transporter [Pararhodobacter sp. CCB-MM2]